MSSYTITTYEDRKTGIWMANVKGEDGNTVIEFPYDLAISDRVEVDGIIDAAVAMLGLKEPHYVEHDKEFVHFGYLDHSDEMTDDTNA